MEQARWRGSRRHSGSGVGALPGGAARRHDPLRPRRRGHQDREARRRGDAPNPPMVRGQSVYFIGLQPRQEERLPRPAQRAGQGGLRRPCADGRHRARELPARRDGEDGLRLRRAAHAQARHHPGLGLRLRAVRPVPRAPGLRPARPGDERADDADRPARRPAARHRLLAWSIATPRCTRRSARWPRCAIASAPAKARWSTCCLLDSALTMVEIPTSYYLATGAGGRRGRAAAVSRRRTAGS